MLTEEEKKFLAWWEANREKEKKVFRQWLIGLPIGMLFGIAIAVNFSSGWNKQAAYTAGNSFNPLVLIIAILIITTFVAIFSKKHKWEMNEQLYKEFKAKETID
ncbi:MAG TPA: hypothetical protein VJ647_05315 [Chitinophagaceae bacterium]|nr:hypothetical protein [Chitinophagaceae bacterium]